MQVKLKVRITNDTFDSKKEPFIKTGRFYLCEVIKSENKLPNHLALNGFMVQLFSGMTYNVEGKYEKTDKGHSIKVTHVQETFEMDFLTFSKIIKDVCKLKGIKGLASKALKEVHDTHGVDAISILEDDHTAEIYFKGKGVQIAEALREKKDISQLSAYLHNKGFDSRQSEMIMRRFKNNFPLIKNNVEVTPYKMVLMNIPYVSFKTIDNMALKMFGEKILDSKERIEAGILFVIQKAEKEAHCFLKPRQLFNDLYSDLGFKAKLDTQFIHIHNLNCHIDDLKGILENDPNITSEYNKYLKPFKLKVNECLENVVKEGFIRTRQFDLDNPYNKNTIGYYVPKLYNMEIYVSNKIKSMANTESSFPLETIKMEMDRIVKEDIANGTLSKYGLTDEQYNACINSVRKKFSVVTGSAGTGKTLTTRYILKLFNAMGIENPMICAPTGKAADRASKVTGLQGGTIHRVLGYRGEKFSYNSENPLRNDLGLVDESSMIDLPLFYAFMKAINEESHVVLIGDPNQLPSVGAGYVLGDVINSGLNTSRLTKVFRQGEGSLLDFVDDIRLGKTPVIADILSDDYKWNPKNQIVATTFQSIEKKGLTVNEVLIDFIQDKMPNVYGLNEIQALGVKYDGENQVNSLNSFLRQVLNPSSNPEVAITANNKTVNFKTGDRVIHTVNNPKLGMPQNTREYGNEHSAYEDDVEYGVFNGEVGIVKMVNPKDTIFSVEYPNGNGGTKTLQYKNPKEHGQVQQAWCITVHKSQGSEYDVVFLSLPKSAKFMMDKTLLYTAVTRASKLIFIIYEGEEIDDFGNIVKPSVIDYAVKQNKPLQRNTGLEFLLKQKDNEVTEEIDEYAIFAE